MAAARVTVRSLMAVRIVMGMLAASALAGCAHPAALTLTGPRTNVALTIPDGWHQVINTANPLIPEMVSPTTCRGAAEVSCALGLARTATFTAKSLEEAADAVRQSVVDDRRITNVTDVSKGPGKVGSVDGYRYRFTFRNPQANLTAEVAAVPVATAPAPDGTSEFSVILVWVSDKPDAPKPDIIDQIVGSAQLQPIPQQPPTAPPGPSAQPVAPQPSGPPVPAPQPPK